MMGKGVEMMVTAAIKAAGINPTELMEKVTDLIHNVNSQLEAFGQRLNSIDERLDAIEKNLGIDNVEISDKQEALIFEAVENDE